MYDQDHHGLPELQSARDEETAPAQGRADEEGHPDLDDATGIEAVRERAGRTEKGRNGNQCEMTAKPPSAGE